MQLLTEISSTLLLLCGFSSACMKLQDCVVSEWSSWQCSSKCSIGQLIRSRLILRPSCGILQKPCPPDLSQTSPSSCGKRNDCEVSCSESTGSCVCPDGYKLAQDQRSCIDVNECSHNDGLGSCNQRCTNLPGRYKCWCLNGFKLNSNGHDCDYNKLPKVCSSEKHYHNKEGECVCRNELSGIKCDRNMSFCKQSYNCREGDVCVKFIYAVEHCISKAYQLPVLLPIPYNTYVNNVNIVYKIEKQIEVILEGELSTDNLNKNPSRNRRDVTSRLVYVEGSTFQKVKSMYTYARFVVMDVNNDFYPLETRQLCKSLGSSDIRCLNRKDCNILRSSGIVCPFIYIPTTGSQSVKQEKQSFKPWTYGLIFGLIFVVTVSFILFLFLRWRKKRKTFNNINDDYSDQHFQSLITGYDSPRSSTADNPADNSAPTVNNDPWKPDTKAFDVVFRDNINRDHKMNCTVETMSKMVLRLSPFINLLKI